MKKVVVMFSGQGSQKISMGENLFDKYADLTRVSNEILNYDIKQLCQGHFGDLHRTLYTQPALFVVNHLMFLDYLEKNTSVEIAYLLGHSLGEFNGLCASGSLSFEDALKIVKKRAELMDIQKGGGMLAVLAMDEGDISSVLKENGDTIDMANINADGQIVISGLKEDIDNIVPKLIERGAKKVVPLVVSGAFHSRYMTQAREAFFQYLEPFNFGKFNIPVVSNKTAKEYLLEEARQTIAYQIDNSVLWKQSILYTRQKGDFEYVEISPNPVLMGLLKRI